MSSKHWHNLVWFGLGTFFGGYVLSAVGGIFGRKG